jgi:hypothetical protein
MAVPAGAQSTTQSEEGSGGWCDKCTTYQSYFCDGGTCHEHHEVYKTVAGSVMVENVEQHSFTSGWPYSCESHNACMSTGGELLAYAEKLDEALYSTSTPSTMLVSTDVSWRLAGDRVELSTKCPVSGQIMTIAVPVSAQARTRLGSLLPMRQATGVAVGE